MPRRPDDPTTPTDQTQSDPLSNAQSADAERAQQEQARAKAQRQAQQKQQKSDDSGFGLGDIVNIANPAEGVISAAAGALGLGKPSTPPGIKAPQQVGHAVETTPPVQAVEHTTAGDVFRQGVQWGASALQAPYEGLTANLRGAVKEVGDQGLAALDPFAQTPEAKKQTETNPAAGGSPTENQVFQQTTLGQMATGKSAGEGYLPNADSPAGKAQAEAARRNSPYTIGGHAWTPGRALGNVVSEPGSQEFNVLSGAVDATSQWFLDPANKALAATSEQRAAAKAIAATSEAAQIDRGFARGGQVVDAFRGSDADLIQHSAPGMSRQVAERIANASDDNTIKGILKGEIPSGPGGTTKIGAGDQVSFLSAAGGTHGLTNRVDGAGNLDYLASPAGDRLRSKLMDTQGDMGQLWRTMNKAPAEYPGSPRGAFYQDLSNAVKDAHTQVAAGTDPVEASHAIDEPLARALGVNIQNDPRAGKAFSLGYQYQKVADSTRSLGLQPAGSQINWGQSTNKVVEQMERLGNNAHIPVEERNKIIDQYLSNPASRANHENVASVESQLLERGFVANGMPEDKAKFLAQYSRQHDDQFRAYALNQEVAGGPVYSPILTGPNTGELMTDPNTGEAINWAEHPSNLNEILNSSTSFPDWRSVGQWTSKNQALLHNLPVDAATGLADKFMGIWKPLRIARPALFARIFADAQSQVAIHGFDGAFNHPLAFAAQVMGTPNSLIARGVRMISGHGRGAEEGLTAGAADKIGTSGLEGFASGESAGPLASLIERAHTHIGKSGVDIHGAPFDPQSDEVFGGYLNNGLRGYLGDSYDAHVAAQYAPQAVLGPDGAVNPLAARGLAADLNRMANPITNHALNDADQGFDWFWNGAGSGLRNDISQNTNLGWLANDEDRTRSYLGLQAQNAQSMTGGDPKLLGVLAGDKPMIADEPLTRGGQINPDAVKAIQDVLAEGNGPQYAKVQTGLLDAEQGGKAGSWDRTKEAARQAFSLLSSAPDAALDRSPLYRQQMWREYKNVAPLLPEDELGKLKGAAEQGNLGAQGIGEGLAQAGREVRTAPGASIGAQALGGAAEAAGTVGAGVGRATRAVQRIFGAAPSNVVEDLKGVESSVQPGDLRALTLDQAHEVAQARTLDNLGGVAHDLNNRGLIWDQLRLAAPFGDAWAKIMQRWSRDFYEQPELFRRTEQIVEGARGNGFFRKDPTTGEESFMLPGTEWATKQATGIPAPMTAPVSGLSILGEGLPGIGPVAALSASTLLKDTPTWQAIKDRIYPYGEPKETGNVFPDTVEALNPLPSFTNRLFAAASDPERNREQGNAVGWVMRYNLSTGKYNTNSAGAIDRLYQDSVKEAQKISVARGVVQAFSPAAPAVDWQVIDKGGKQKSGRELVNEWTSQLQGKQSYDQAYGKFIQKHGEGNMLLTQAFSEPVKGFQAFTDSADKWTASNQDLRRKYPNTFGLFAPSDGPFSISAWQHQLDAGDRKTIPPSELVHNANDRNAAFLYRQRRQELSQSDQGLNDEGRAQLASYKDFLSQTHPGYKPNSFDTGKNPALIAELQQATQDPSIYQQSPTMAKAVSKYLSARDDALNNASGSSLQGKSDEELRRHLKNYGDQLAKQYRGFGRVFDAVFATEVH